MTGALSPQQGLYGVAASVTRPVEKPEARDRLRVSDSTGPRLGVSLPNRVTPPLPRRQNDEPEQGVEPRVAPATLMEASLIAATLVNAEQSGFTATPLRAAPWQPPLSSLPLRDRKA